MIPFTLLLGLQENSAEWGLEGAVKLGFRKELEAETDPKKKEISINKLVERYLRERKAIEAAAHLEIDAVIDPADTRKVILKALKNKFI